MPVDIVHVLGCGCKVRAERTGLLTRWIKTFACEAHQGGRAS